MDTPDRTVWRKSSYSDNNGGACVEVAATDRSILVRDSKDPSGPALCFDRRSWSAFMARLNR
ncbi:DUF397 domain-containing protein [Micromonospora sp. NPDC047707]|uniref:DUF397 domain-containing protein n=1 Tax=unclassified Micromonospora TaxID=2617518 RepID=UPI0012B4D809|nr:DUF397 domain-containing protein [Micromonospora sp. WMMC415]QGN50088.1 DUF397 domain-containing protein [Micromonospora sp. WMMC415]